MTTRRRDSLTWVAVMTLGNGTTIEMPMPSGDGTDGQRVHRYRVRGPDGTSQFQTLSDVATHVLDPQETHMEEELTRQRVMSMVETALGLPPVPSG
ncbi:MAG TPA: hypothetical protein VHR35_09120 [Nocardioides sp.]|jgi:hypothetical protein|nr:hypothetical protein [Nocardioides sp.]